MPLYKTIQDIKNNKLFSGVKEHILTSFFDQKEIKEAREGEIIYKTGDESNALYLIIKGDIRVKFPAHNYLSNKSFNDFCGEKEIIDDIRRISSAVAFSRLIYYRLDKVIFKSLLTKNPTIDNNLRKHGELKLPDVSLDLDRKFDIVDRKKPISFKAFSDRRNTLEEEKNEDKVPPAVVTQQILPDLESIEELIAKEQNIFEEKKEELKKESLEHLEDSKDLKVEKIKILPQTAKVSKNLTEDKKYITSSEPEERKTHLLLETGINREVVRKIFTSIDRIYSGVSITELIKNANRALKDLTNSEGTDLILIDEKLSSMQRIRFEGEKIKNEHFQLADGLTGSCALQKKIINYDRPTEDSRFNAKIDQPGPARLKRILYFPVISDSGETIAVIQTARENKKFSEDEVSYLTMLSKQIETAIERTKFIEQLVHQEKLSSGKKLHELVTKEIQVPINVINNYTEILSQKKLPSEADDIIRMLQKQAHAVEEITDTIFLATLDKIILNSRNIHFNELINDILELLSEYCEAREVKLFKKIGDGAIVDIDRSKFYTAIFQIIKSSCDDSRKAGKIYFSTEFIEGMISITIQNEGKGALKDPEGDVLDYFYSKENIKDDEVGLLLAKKIILSHSGQFNLESIKGNGSTFRITLPAVQSEDKAD